MKIFLNDDEISKCNSLLEIKENNISSVEIYIDYLINHSKDIKDKDIYTLKKKYNNTEECFYNAFLKKLNIQKNDNEYDKIDKICNIHKMKLLNFNDYENDEYYKNIKPFKVAESNISLVEMSYDAYEGFVYDEIIVNENNYSEFTPFGFFDKKFPFLALVKNNEIWMSIIPHEINTMKNSIQEAKGNVLVMGLGLGYYLYNICLKEDVTKIDVIENDNEIIKIFKQNLLKNFKNKEKINIIYGDGIEYLNIKRNYDYIFCDIYHNVHDGEMLYLKVKSKEFEHENTKFSYWIETSILAMLRRQILTLFEEEINGSTDNDYLKFKNDNDIIINKLHFYLKNYTIQKFEDLHKLISEYSLKNIAKNLLKIK